jgi:hypothetical protein
VDPTREICCCLASTIATRSDSQMHLTTPRWTSGRSLRYLDQTTAHTRKSSILIGSNCCNRGLKLIAIGPRNRESFTIEAVLPHSSQRYLCASTQRINKLRSRNFNHIASSESSLKRSGTEGPSNVSRLHPWHASLSSSIYVQNYRTLHSIIIILGQRVGTHTYIVTYTSSL